MKEIHTPKYTAICIAYCWTPPQVDYDRSNILGWNFPLRMPNVMQMLSVQHFINQMAQSRDPPGCRQCMSVSIQPPPPPFHPPPVCLLTSQSPLLSCHTASLCFADWHVAASLWATCFFCFYNTASHIMLNEELADMAIVNIWRERVQVRIIPTDKMAFTKLIAKIRKYSKSNGARNTTNHTSSEEEVKMKLVELWRKWKQAWKFCLGQFSASTIIVEKCMFT